METVISADGTQIAFWREGCGPPLLLVHGGLCDHFAWHYALPILARRFTVFTFDRRGRGASGEGRRPHSAEREREDIATMLRKIGEPAHLLGHSAGGILALQARCECELRSLILYEPAFVVDGARERPGPEVLAAIELLLTSGDREQALRIAIRESVGASDAEIAGLSAGPGWVRLVAAAGAIPNDWILWEERFRAEEVRAFRTPTLMLMGSESPLWLRKGTEAILAALPNAQLSVMPGEGHSAMIASPQLFAQAVIQFAERH